ncbi:MAG TPA: POTRA domain-containing protein, partial [Flavisolibacter sp.]
MAKLKLLFAAISFLTTFIRVQAQSYPVQYRITDGDTSFAEKYLLRSLFGSKEEAGIYISGIPGLLKNQGYITASVDKVQLDSASASVQLYIGERYRWAHIETSPADQKILQAIRWPSAFKEPLDFTALDAWQQKVLDHLEENGHPFGKVYLDSIRLDGSNINALLKIDPGPIYKIDSIRVYGDAKVSNDFLQRYLGISNGSYYNRKKLEGISSRLATISYLVEERPSTLDFLGTGGILNLYLKDRKTSQVNALIGFLPNSDQASGGKKLLLTVDANILLRNALGSGETIGLVWQQLQQRSPRLNLLFEQPYMFRSPFGLNFTFDMYKRDSIFLNINMNLGAIYRVQEKQTFSVFLQRRQTIVNGINTSHVLQSKKLPQEGDVSSLNLGMSYQWFNTDFRFNPGKGNELMISGSAGTKKIRKNNLILELEDPSDPSFQFETLYDGIKLKAYQFRIVTAAAQFIPLGGQSTLKLGVNGGIYQSASYFRNELFQIGGFKLLRGFDEESQFVSQYAIGTVEYRLRTGLNSYFFGFV